MIREHEIEIGRRTDEDQELLLRELKLFDKMSR